jgi:hypothetical protein
MDTILLHELEYPAVGIQQDPSPGIGTNQASLLYQLMKPLATLQTVENQRSDRYSEVLSYFGTFDKNL